MSPNSAGVVFALCFVLCAGAPSFAQSPVPNAPQSFYQKTPTDPFRCERFFTYKGKVLTCDSNLHMDAEKLRPILKEVPTAIDELNIYQQDRRSVKNAAYLGSLGLVVMIVGLLVSRQYTNPDSGDLSATGHAVRNVGVISGLGLAGGSLIYGLSVLKTSEIHLGKAVEIYNNAHPESPVELQFSTGISF